MPALIPTDHYGTIIWLGFQPIPVADLIITAEPLAEMALGFDGLAGETHAGLTRPSCSRVKAQYPRGTEIANVRQLCIVSAEEMAAVAATLGMDRIDPAWVGASVVLSGIPDFTHIPPSSRLQADNGTTLTVDMENHPCIEPAATMRRALNLATPPDFKAAATGKRGVTAWVERPGCLRVGDRVRLHVPGQRAWALLQ
jgi:hypothetical protein